MGATLKELSFAFIISTAITAGAASTVVGVLKVATIVPSEVTGLLSASGWYLIFLAGLLAARVLSGVSDGRKKSTWIPIAFGATLAAGVVALFGWPGPTRQFLLDQKDLIRSLAGAVAILSTAAAAVWRLRAYLRESAESARSAPYTTWSPAIQVAERGVAIGGSADNTVISTGDGNIIAGTVNVTAATERRDPAAGDPAIAAGDLARARETYLGHLRDRYRYLDMKGLGIADRVPLRLPLRQLFVPLLARPELPAGDTWDLEARMAGRQLSEQDAERLGRRLGEPRKVLDLVRQHPGLVILGDPGSGKTTFLKYLALTFAAGEGSSLGLGERLPVLVPLSGFANALAAGEVRLDEFVRGYVDSRGADPAVGELLDVELREGRALLLLDGLDEVREAALRQTVVRAVADFFSFHRKAGNKFVLTSRIVGYREVRTVSEGLAECTLVDFGDEEISTFVGKWTVALERQALGETEAAATEAKREQQELVAAIGRNPGVRHLAANPLLLTILALMKRQGVSLPERRVALYEQYVKTLLQSWNRARGLGRPPERDLDVVETVRILAPLALWMHEVDPGLGLVKLPALEAELCRIYQARRAEDPEVASRRLLADAREWAGLVLERGPGQWGFIHLTFEEYLAAVAIALEAQGNPRAMLHRLAPHLGDPAWREVSLLLVAYVGLVQQLDAVAGGLVEALARERPGPPGEAVVLAGDAILEVGATGVGAGSREVVTAALVESMQSTEVPNTLRRRAGLALGRLGWSPEDLDAFVAVPAGPFLFGEEKEERKIAEPYWIGKYPVTNLQYAHFVTDGGYRRREFWSEAGWAWRSKEERDGPFSWGEEDENPIFPRVGVTFYEADAYCRWLAATSEGFHFEGDPGPEGTARFTVRLPTEEEWERAARGAEGREYPWGASFDVGLANTKESGEEGKSGIGATAVCTFVQGVSPVGAFDMSGNIFEWTGTRQEDKYFKWCGGCWYFTKDFARCAARNRYGPDDFFFFNVGFRVVLSLANSES